MNKLRHKYYPFPQMSMKRNGVLFFSFKTHRLKLASSSKILKIGNNLLIISSRIVKICNVQNVFMDEGYVYFKALGKVFVELDCNNIFRYFNVDITSSIFSLETIRQQAMADILNNDFDFEKCYLLKRYIKIIKQVLKIEINENKLVIKQNKLRLPFQIKYKCNKAVKTITVNKTLEEFNKI